MIPALVADAQAEVSIVSPNLAELREMYGIAREMGAMDREGWWEALDELGLGEEWRNGVERSARKWGIDDLLVKDGGTVLFVSPMFSNRSIDLD